MNLHRIFISLVIGVNLFNCIPRKEMEKVRYKDLIDYAEKIKYNFPFKAESLLIYVRKVSSDSLCVLKAEKGLYRLYLLYNEKRKAYEIFKNYRDSYLLDSFPSYEKLLLDLRKYDEILKYAKSSFLKAIAAESLGFDSLALSLYRRSMIFGWIKDRRVLEIFFKRKLYDSVIVYGERIFKKDDEIIKKLVIAFMVNKKYKKAREWVRRMRDEKEKLYFRFLIAEKEKNKKEMRKVWRLLIKKFPFSNRTKEVISKVSPLTSEEFFWAGVVYSKIDYDKAEFFLKKAEKDRNYRERARNKIAKIEFKKKNYEKVKEILKNQRDEESLYILYKTYLKQKDTVRAVFYLKKLIEEYPKNYRYYLYLGRIYEAVRDYTQALGIYKEGYNKTKSKRIEKRLIALLYFLKSEEAIKKLPKSAVKFYYLYRLTKKKEYKDSLCNLYPYSFYSIYLNKKPVLDTTDLKVLIEGLEKNKKVRSYLFDTLKVLVKFGLYKESEKFLKRKRLNLLECLEVVKLYKEYGVPELSIKWAEKIRKELEKRGIKKYPLSLLKHLYPPCYIFTIKESAEDVGMMLSLIRQESWFNPRAKSWAGAIGLCQLIFSTAKGLDKNITIDSLFIPEINIPLGAKYLRIQKNRFKDYIYALAAYNAGPGNLKKWLTDFPSEIFLDMIPLYETEDYVKKVLRGYYIYKSIYTFL